MQDVGTKAASGHQCNIWSSIQDLGSNAGSRHQCTGTGSHCIGMYIEASLGSLDQLVLPVTAHTEGVQLSVIAGAMYMSHIRTFLLLITEHQLNRTVQLMLAMWPFCSFETSSFVFQQSDTSSTTQDKFPLYCVSHEPILLFCPTGDGHHRRSRYGCSHVSEN